MCFFDAGLNIPCCDCGGCGGCGCGIDDIPVGAPVGFRVYEPFCCWIGSGYFLVVAAISSANSRLSVVFSISFSKYARRFTFFTFFLTSSKTSRLMALNFLLFKA